MTNEQPNPYANTPKPMTPADERLWSTLVHVGGTVANVFSLGGFGWIIGLVGYLLLKDRGPFVRAHTATEMNFQLTIVIAAILGWMTAFFGIGLLILGATWVIGLVFGIVATVKANKGEYYTYPIAIPFVS